MNFETLLELLKNYGLPGGLSLIIICFFFNPDKVAKWSAIISKIFQGVNKFNVKFSIQADINSYSKAIAKKYNFIPYSVKIKWLTKNENKKNFLDNKKAFIYLRKSDNANENLVRTAMAFTSVTLLPDTRKCLADYQRKGIDLYTCYDMLQTKKISDDILREFNKIYYDKSENKVQDIFDKCAKIQKYGIFYSILIQELVFLDNTLIPRKYYAKIHEEITELIDYLERYAQRNEGEEIGSFDGNYCRFSIMIIGIKKNIENNDSIYQSYLEKIYKKHSTIYLLGNLMNKKFIKEFFENMKEKINYSLVKDYSYKAKINRRKNKSEIDSYLMVIKNNKKEHYKQD